MISMWWLVTLFAFLACEILNVLVQRRLTRQRGELQSKLLEKQQECVDLGEGQREILDANASLRSSAWILKKRIERLEKELGEAVDELAQRKLQVEDQRDLLADAVDLSSRMKEEARTVIEQNRTLVELAKQMHRHPDMADELFKKMRLL
jgi:chromosome segregation ATPase